MRDVDVDYTLSRIYSESSILKLAVLNIIAVLSVTLSQNEVPRKKTRARTVRSDTCLRIRRTI